MPEKVKFLVNSKIEIAWNDVYYKSTIEGSDSRTISISIPIKDGEYVPLRIGDTIEVIYYHEQDIYKFNTRVINRKSDVIPIIILEYPNEVFKVQRRKFVRVPIVCYIVYSKIGKQEGGRVVISTHGSPKELKGIMVDLSGGGTRIKLHEKLEKGDVLLINMPLGKDNISVKGEIVRVDFEELNKLYVSGISFIDLDERTRDKLIKYIFQEMRDQMKKGLKK
jgi:c-di-GMP-binding flagellar brake protein YcgR